MSAGKDKEREGVFVKKKKKKTRITKTCPPNSLLALLSPTHTFEKPSSISFCAASSYAWMTDARAAARLRPRSANASGSSAEESSFVRAWEPIEGAAVEEALPPLLKAAASVVPRRRRGKCDLTGLPGVDGAAGRAGPAARRREGTEAAEAAEATRSTRALQGMVAAGIVSECRPFAFPFLLLLVLGGLLTRRGRERERKGERRGPNSFFFSMGVESEEE